MLKQITSIILINSLLFPQYVFAECLTGAEAECDKPSDLVDSNTPQEKPNKTFPEAAKEVKDGQSFQRNPTGQRGQGYGEDRKLERAREREEYRERGKVYREQQKEKQRLAAEKIEADKAAAKIKADAEAEERDRLSKDPAKLPNFPTPTFQGEQTGAPRDQVKFLGTSLFLNCQGQTSNAWGDMVEAHPNITPDMWTDSWVQLTESIKAELEPYKLDSLERRELEKGQEGFTTVPAGETPEQRDARLEEERFNADDRQRESQNEPKERCGAGTFDSAKCKLLFVKRFVKKGIARGKGKALTLKKCSALVPSTSFMDYKSSEDTLAITPKASLDKKIACRSRGAETQDYPSCRKLVSWWDGFFIGKKLMETAQAVKYQMDAKDRQEDLALDMASKNPDPLLPLKMQKAGVDDQAAVAFQNSFFLGAQYAVMQTKFSQWPSREEVVQTCQKAFAQEGSKKGTRDKMEAFGNDVKKKFEEFAKKFKKQEEKTEPKPPPEVPDINLTEYLRWYKELIKAFDDLPQKIKITDLMEDFKNKDKIVASCPLPPLGQMMGMDTGGGGRFSTDYYDRPSYSGDQSSTGAGEGEGMIGGGVKYDNCETVFMQSFQMDSRSPALSPQFSGSGGSPYSDDQGSGSGGFFDRQGSVGMPGGEMMMGAMLGQSDDPCIDVMNSGTQLILNFQSREALKMVLVQTGIEALTNLMKGMMLRKQSAKIQSLIDGMPVPDPTLDKLSQNEEDLIASVCTIAPQEPICADFSNRSNGFNSPNIDLTPPSASTSLARVNAEAQGANAVEKAMTEIAAKEFGEAAAYNDAAGGAGGGASKTPSVTFKAGEKGAGGGDIGTPAAKDAEAMAAAEKGAGGEETATPETGYTGGTEARDYKGPGFRADQYKGSQGGGLDKIAGEYGSMGFREPSSEGISPKEAGGLFKIISDRYEAISKDRRIEGKTEIAK